MKRIEEAFGFYLLSAKEQEQYYFEFNIDGLLRGDQKSRFDAYHTAIMDGWMSPNEVREKENLPAIAGGDVYLLPVNMAGYAGEDKVEQNENG
jgi:phage portal protein BeeE